MLEICRGFGLDPIAGSRSRSPAPVLRMPLLYVHGRSDSTLSVHGANIYPEDVEWGLGESPDAAAVAGFTLDLAEDHAGVLRPRVHVETWRDPAAYDGGLAAARRPPSAPGCSPTARISAPPSPKTHRRRIPGPAA